MFFLAKFCKKTINQKIFTNSFKSISSNLNVNYQSFGFLKKIDKNTDKSISNKNPAEFHLKTYVNK